MSALDRLLKAYVPPPVPEGLAGRAAAAAMRHAQGPARPASGGRRHDRKRGWRAHPFLAGGAAVCLAFTGAVAATYASDGRIDIPVVRDVIAAVPLIPQPSRPETRRAAMTEAAKPKPRAEAVPAGAEPVQQVHLNPLPPRAASQLAQAQRITEARRAAGLPTPRADRIERTARRIVERRQARGLPTLPVEEVEGRLALRELRRVQLMRSLRAQGYAVNQQVVERIIERLPPDKRARFERLPPTMQRALILRHLRRMQQRREGFSEPAR